jgi:hypothetical protein
MRMGSGRKRLWRKGSENYRLGLEGKGVDLNNSSRYRNEFDKNNRPLFPSKGKGRSEETRNWIASFNHSGCIGCKEGSDSVHKGRDGKPLVLVVGVRPCQSLWESQRRKGMVAAHGS